MRVIRRTRPACLRLDNHNAKHTARIVRIRRGAGVKATRGKLPAQIPPVAIERQYQKAIIERVIERVRRAIAPLLAELPRLLASANRERSALLHDAGEGRRVRELMEQARETIAESVTTRDLERLAREVSSRTADYQGTQLHRQVRAAFGADVFSQDRALRPLTEAFVDANVGLIKKIGDDLATEIESATMRAIQDGMLHGDLAKELEGRFGFAEKRAELIARDQVGKAYGQINAARQRELGVTRFIWRTVGDERVRSEHEDREGETYEYSDPPDGELPGEPINCRCYAEPVFDDVLAELDEPAEEPAAEPAPETVPAAEPAPEPPPEPLRELDPSPAPSPVAVPQFVTPVPEKNPRRVEAARKAAEVSAERRREIHSAVKSNLSPELQTVWDKEGHKFMQQEAGRIKGIKDRINASSKLSEAFAEKYGSGDESVFGNEGDRYAKRAEIEAQHAETWADEQERQYYEAAQREGDDTDADQRAANDAWANPPANAGDDDPPF